MSSSADTDATVEEILIHMGWGLALWAVLDGARPGTSNDLIRKAEAVASALEQDGMPDAASAIRTFLAQVLSGELAVPILGDGGS